MFFSEQESDNRALIIHPDFDGEIEDQREIRHLALTAQAEIVACVTVKLRTIHPSYFIGTGKLEEIAALVKQTGADLIVVNAHLSPSQERNIERALACRVIDRNRLILDIFAQRARSHEGKLQVELAQLEYMATRLVRGWTHLERQKGGIGLRGPGESQLETDRRLLGIRVSHLKKQLHKVRSQRLQNRQNRFRTATPTISIIGYTNAGKSSLFNQLTESTAYAADKLFATLDTTSRRLVIPGIGNCVVTDTVGFIRNLPHKLIEAFKATLEEISLANLLLHLIDASDENYEEKINAVQAVLEEIDATDIQQIIIFNKIDQLDYHQRQLLPMQIHTGDNSYPAIQVSALKREGFAQLLEAIADHLAQSWYSGWLRIRAAQAGSIRSELYQLKSISEETSSEDGDLLVRVRLPQSYLDQHPDIIRLVNQF